MATIPSSSSAAGSATTNPFADPKPYSDHNFRSKAPSMTSSSKFDIVDHVYGSIDAHTMCHDSDSSWMQIDKCIMSWLYNTVIPDLMKMIVMERPVVYLIWFSIPGLFLHNANQLATYALHEFHSLFQNGLTITTCFSRFKQLVDLLFDICHTVTARQPW